MTEDDRCQFAASAFRVEFPFVDAVGCFRRLKPYLVAFVPWRVINSDTPCGEYRGFAVFAQESGSIPPQRRFPPIYDATPGASNGHQHARQSLPRLDPVRANLAGLRPADLQRADPA